MIIDASQQQQIKETKIYLSQFLPIKNKMQSPLKFYKAKLHIYSKLSPKKFHHPQTQNVYRFCSERAHTEQHTSELSLTEKSPDDQFKFCDRNVRLSVWNLHSNKVSPKDKRAKVTEKKYLSSDTKTSKTPSHYLIRMQQKRKFLKDHYAHIKTSKNINQIHVNRINPINLTKNDSFLKTINQPTINNQLGPKLNHPSAFSQRFKSFKLSLRSQQTHKFHFFPDQNENSLSYTLNISDLCCQKKSQGLFTKLKFNKTQKKTDFSENLQAWTNRSCQDDEIHIDLISRKKTPQRPKSKSFRNRHTKLLAQ